MRLKAVPAVAIAGAVTVNVFFSEIVTGLLGVELPAASIAVAVTA